MHGQPRPYRYLSDMPDRARVALERCHTDHVYIGHHATHHIATRTINVLIVRTLITESRDKRSKKIWRPSHTGLQLLTREEPRLLAAKLQRGYTTNTALAAMGEPEAVDAQFQRYLTADAHDRHQGLPGRRQEHLRNEAVNLTRRLKQATRSCDTGHLEVAAQLERIRVEIERLEGLQAA
jgi:hypothetical protein